MKALSRLLRLARRTSAERRAVIAALAYLLRAWLRHRRMPAAVLIADLRDGAHAAPDGGAAEHLRTMAWALNRAARVVPFRSDCLVQALAAQAWLTAHGQPYSFHLGVNVDADPTHTLSAHAWVESGGIVISGGAISQKLQRFAPEATEGRGLRAVEPEN